MKRNHFLLGLLTFAPLTTFASRIAKKLRGEKPFQVDAGKSRFGAVEKFMGVHPNDLKVSSQDTEGELSIFEFTGLGKVGPQLHIHYHQDEIFYVVSGEYRFKVGEEMKVLKAGDTIFLPRNLPHTWLQLTDHGKLIYFLQPAGKMEEFFSYMAALKTRPSEEEMDRIHKSHGMSVLGPPLTL
jgi:quercetin dioxygenase-like cupin family protein